MNIHSGCPVGGTTWGVQNEEGLSSGECASISEFHVSFLDISWVEAEILVSKG